MKSSCLLFRIRFWILISALAAAAVIFLTADSQRFVADVSKLLPEAESFQTDAQLLSQFREKEERLILGALVFSGNETGTDRQTAENRFHSELAASEAFVK